MYCGKCGGKLGSDDKFCGGCGIGTAQEKLVISDPTSPVLITNKKISNTHVGMIACAAVGLVAIVVFISIFFVGNTPEGVLQRYFSTSFNGNYFRADRRYSALNVNNSISGFLAELRLTEREYNERLYRTRGYRNIRAYINAQAQEETERLQNEFGRDYTVTVEIIDSRELTGRILENHIDLLRLSYELRGHDPNSIIQLDRIRSIVRVEAYIIISGSLGHGSRYVEVEVAQIGRRWRVMQDGITGRLPRFG